MKCTQRLRNYQILVILFGMRVRFNNDYLERLFIGLPVKGKPKLSSIVALKFKKTIVTLQNAEDTRQLKKIRGLNFEALKGDYQGYYSVRVDYSYRLILSIEQEIVSVKEVLVIENLTNHYS